MNFFNIGPMELVFILVLALLVFGPRKLPEIARDLGKTINEFRRASQELTSKIGEELNAELEAPKEGKEPTEPSIDQSTPQGSGPEGNPTNE